MRKFGITTGIAAPPERVWQVMSDTDRWHEWTPSVTSIKRLDGWPFAVGSRAMIRQPKFPPALWKVTAIEPAAAGSRETLSLEIQGILGGILGRLTKTITERYLAFEAKGLKARSEDPAFYCGDLCE